MKALAASLATLSEETKTIEETLALLRCGKRQTAAGESCLERLRTHLAVAEAETIRLKTLQPDDPAIDHYEARLKAWRQALARTERPKAPRPLRWLDHLEKAARQEEEAEDRRLRPIYRLSLPEDDPQALVRTLLDLSVRIEPRAGFNAWNDKQYAALKAKFDSGLLLLRAADPDNPMLPGLEARQRAWDTKRRNALLGLWAGIGALLLISLLLSFFEQ